MAPRIRYISQPMDYFPVALLLAIAITGVTTFLFSAVGLKIGNIFGSKYKSKAELIGGIILALMGIKILIEHLTGAA